MAKTIVDLPISFEERLKNKRAEYAAAFRIDELNDANDKSNLDMMLKTELMVDSIQEKIKILMDEDVVENVAAIKKLSDLLKDARDTVLAIQRALAIDRRTRKTEETTSVADYIRTLKRDAHDFMEQRIIKVYCPECKVMAGRIYPVHDHTAFSCSFQCDQCHKLVRARREEKDILFDIRDSHWRKQYQAEVVQPKRSRKVEYEDDDLVLIGEPDIQGEEAPGLDVHTPQDNLELGGEE